MPTACVRPAQRCKSSPERRPRRVAAGDIMAGKCAYVEAQDVQGRCRDRESGCSLEEMYREMSRCHAEYQHLLAQKMSTAKAEVEGALAARWPGSRVHVGPTGRRVVETHLALLHEWSAVVLDENDVECFRMSALAKTDALALGTLLTAVRPAPSP